MFGLTSKQRNATKMVCYSELTSSLTSAEIKPILILDNIKVNTGYLIYYRITIKITVGLIISFRFSLDVGNVSDNNIFSEVIFFLVIVLKHVAAGNGKNGSISRKRKTGN